MVDNCSSTGDLLGIVQNMKEYPYYHTFKYGHHLCMKCNVGVISHAINIVLKMASTQNAGQ